MPKTGLATAFDTMIEALSDIEDVDGYFADMLYIITMDVEDENRERLTI